MATFPGGIYSVTNPTASSPRTPPTGPAEQMTGANNEIIAIENWLGANGATMFALAKTLTNTRVPPRVLTLTGNAPQPTFNTNNYDVIYITSQSAAITSFTANQTGTPQAWEELIIAVQGTTSIAFTYGTLFEASGTVPLPNGTTGTTLLTMGFSWNPGTSKWRMDGYS